MKTLKLVIFSLIVGCSHNLTIKNLKIDKTRSSVFAKKNVAVIFKNSSFTNNPIVEQGVRTYYFKNLHRVFFEGYKKKLYEVANKVAFFEDKTPSPNDIYNFYFYPEVKIRMDVTSDAWGCFVKYKLIISDGSKILASAEKEENDDFSNVGNETIISRTCTNAMEDVFEAVTDEAISKLK